MLNEEPVSENVCGRRKISPPLLVEVEGTEMEKGQR
jgi:hypothetical protein